MDGLPDIAAASVPPFAAGDRAGCIAIAASTGGIAALDAFFAALAPRVGLPILVTQHLPRDFMVHFAQQLATMAGRPALVAEAGVALQPDKVLVAPGDAHLRLKRIGNAVRVRLDRSAAVSGCMPSADPMFASVAEVYGAGAVAVVLSGMGRDGAEGARAVHAAGGKVLAQDRDSAVVWGMPGAVARAGIADVVLPPAALACRIAAGAPGAVWS